MSWEKCSHARLCVLSKYVIVEGFKKFLPRLLGADYTIPNFKSADSEIYYDSDDRLRLQHLINDNLIRNCTRILDVNETVGKEFVAISRDLKRQDFSQVDREELIEAFNEFIGQYERFFSLIDMRREIETLLEKELKKHLVKRTSDVEKAFTTLVVCEEEVLMVTYQKALLKLGIRYYEGLDVEKEAEALAREFEWVTIRFLMGEILSKEEVLDAIREEKEPRRKLEELQREAKQRAAKGKRLAKDLRMTNDPVLKTTKRALFVITRRPELFCEGLTNYRGLLTEIGRHLGLTYKQVIQLTGEEITKHLKEKTKVDPAVIAERDRSNTVIMEDFKVRFLYGAESLAIKEARAVAKTREVKGMTASPGKATGKAVIVLEEEDFVKEEEGMILVTPMTTPNFLPLMQKAAAIVTDIGGITTHAAIVARELGKPCVIGTGNATRMFKDGDLVEVDATKGVVRRLDND